MKLGETIEHKNGKGEVIATLTKVKDAEPMGEYTETSIDREKKKVDFKIVQTNPYYIKWNERFNDRDGEVVDKHCLKRLQENHTWTTDF